MTTDERNETHLRRVIQVCERSSRGIFKRIHENRELLEFIKKNASGFLERYPWVVGWISNNDHFFNDLVQALGSQNPFQDFPNAYPRPWPGKEL